jgi:hypothetical protein
MRFAFDEPAEADTLDAATNDEATSLSQKFPGGRHR